MTTTINASPTNGLLQTADGSGVLKVQSNGVTTNALAWARFSMTGGTLTNNASYNVSSITRSSAGQYSLSFTTATTDANYSVVGSSGSSGSSAAIFIPFANGSGTTTAPTTSGFTGSVISSTASGNQIDATYICLAVFGN